MSRASMIADFYDIESLKNAWTLCNFQPYKNHLEVFMLCDTPALYQVSGFYDMVVKKIYEANLNFKGTVALYDLHDPACIEYMARMFGVSTANPINNPRSPQDRYNGRYRIVCDTDPEYDDDKYPYYMGYNSQNYDMTMLAIFFDHAIIAAPPKAGINNPNNQYEPNQIQIKAPTAAILREYNNAMFNMFKKNMPDVLTRLKTAPNGNLINGQWTIGPPDYQTPAYKIRKNMLMSGRHVDVARLNDKASKVALKRLLGMLGGQILESDKLSQDKDTLYTTEELIDLIAYNASDVINLKLVLFDHTVYQGQFSLKKKLLADYPELVYEKKPDKYEPDISTYHVRRDRLYIDSSSAQLATKALCPYDHLKDIPVVSFMYPSERKAQELGIPRVNVLEECRKFFYSKFPQPDVRAEFDKIYNFYKSIEGRNFNESKNYQVDYQMANGVLPGPGEDPRFPIDQFPYGLGANRTADIAKCDTCTYYYDKNGKPSRGFVTFSIGGIHGAEYNRDLYEFDLAKWQLEQQIMAQVQAQYPNPIDLKAAKHVIVQTVDENGDIINVKFPAGKFLKSGSTLKDAQYKKPDKQPAIFEAKAGGMTLNSDYVYTSADPTNHEDFTSYYPNLLRMLSAFYNEGLGYDRYAEIFYQKQDLGVLMKDKNEDYDKLANKTSPEELKRFEILRKSSGCQIDPHRISDDERGVYAVQREGTKLILNSASGAADASFESNIRMNNVIISMRIIGQLFSWRIGQAQTYEGAKVISTNTDGLFTVMEATLNEQILNRESADINVEIEPEPTFLISKDTNNRIEMDPKTGEVQAASGGTLGCRNWAGKKGPQPTKNLSHPAIIDWALCEYLIFAATDTSGRARLDKPFNPEVGLNILLSAKNKMDKIRLLNMFQNVIASSIGSIRYNFATKPGQPSAPPIILQHYNRVFIMKDNTPNTVHLNAAVARKLTPVQIKNRTKNNERIVQHDPLALDILAANGVPLKDIPETHEAGITKLTNIEDTWFMMIDNRALQFIPDDEVDFLLDNLDYGKYLYLLGNSFENSWRNILPNAAPKTNMTPFTKDLDAAMDAFKNGTLAELNANTGAKPAKAKKNVITPGPANPPAQAQTAQAPASADKPDSKPDSEPDNNAVVEPDITPEAPEPETTANTGQIALPEQEQAQPEDVQTGQQAVEQALAQPESDTAGLPWPAVSTPESSQESSRDAQQRTLDPAVCQLESLLTTMLGGHMGITNLINMYPELETYKPVADKIYEDIMQAIAKIRS